MQNRILFITLLPLFFFCCQSGKSRNEKAASVNETSDSITYDYSVESFQKIRLLGKEIIPYLIEHIDDDKRDIIGFHDRYSSTIPGFLLKGNPVGIKYAYFIELILKDTIVIASSKKGESTYWRDNASPYQIFRYCLIVKKDKNNEQNDDVLTYNDIKKVKDIYFNWWEENKHKPIEQLRKERKENGCILDGSEYIWV